MKHPDSLDATRIDLNLLPIAIALSDGQSVSRAAVQLGMSQPAVSVALSRLRKFCNDPLFVRSARGMTSTPRGEQLVTVAREILRRFEDGLSLAVAFDPATSQRPFTFAMSDVGEVVFLPQLLKRLAVEAPQTRVRSASMPPQQLADALEAGEVDLAIGYFPDLTKSWFFQQRLLSHHFTCLLRADHPIEGAQLTLDQFLQLEHAVVRSEGRSQEIFERFLKTRGIVRKVALHTPHFLSIPHLVAQSDMVVTVPHAVGMVYGTPAHRLKVILPPFVSPIIELKQHWHRRFHRDPRSVWIRGIVSELFNERTDQW